MSRKPKLIEDEDDLAIISQETWTSDWDNLEEDEAWESLQEKE